MHSTWIGARAWVAALHCVLIALVVSVGVDGTKSVRWEDVDAQLRDYGASSSPLQAGLEHCMQEMLAEHCGALQAPLMPSGPATGTLHTTSSQRGLCGRELELRLEVVDYSARHGFVHEVHYAGARVAHFSVFPTDAWMDFVNAIQAFSLAKQQSAAASSTQQSESSLEGTPQGRLRLLDSLASRRGGGGRLAQGTASGPALRPQLGKCSKENVLLLLFLGRAVVGGEVSLEGREGYDRSTTQFIRSAFPSVLPLLHDSVKSVCQTSFGNGTEACHSPEVETFLISHYGDPVGRVDRFPLTSYAEILEEFNSWQRLKVALDKGGHSGTMDLSLVMAKEIHVESEKVLRAIPAHGAMLLEDICSGDPSKDLSEDAESFGFMHCLAALEVTGKGMADMHAATAEAFDLQLIGHSWPRLVSSLLPENSWAVRVDLEGESSVEAKMAVLMHSFTGFVVDEVVKGYQAAARSGIVSGKDRGRLSLIHNDVRMDNMLVLGDFMFSSKPRKPGAEGEPAVAAPSRRRRRARGVQEEAISQSGADGTAIGALTREGETDARMAPTSIGSAIAPAPSLLDIHKMNLELTDFAAKNSWSSNHLQRVIQHFRSSYSEVYQQQLQSSHEEILFRLFALQGLLVRQTEFSLRKFVNLESLKSCLAAASEDSASGTLEAGCRRELSHLLATDTKFYPALLLAIDYAVE